MMKPMYTFKLVRQGAMWIEPIEHTPFLTEYDEDTDTYSFCDITTGEVFNIVKKISEDEVIVG